MNKKLSLCLTTYNRKEELSSTLLNLCKLPSSKYEVIILDASDKPVKQNKLVNQALIVAVKSDSKSGSRNEKKNT